MKKAIIFIFTISIFAVSTAFAQKIDERCIQSGWVTDDDRNGTNVRAAPSLKGKVIEVIPYPEEDFETRTVEIIGYSNGWLKILLGEVKNGKISDEDVGWISAKKVTATVETNDTKPAPLYSQPSKKSKKIGTIPDQESLTIVGVSCFGFKVAYKGKTGWLSSDHYCGNPLTTCP